MTYYKLTDRLHRGDIIRADGSKHYRYSYGEYAWVRTSVMMAYMNDESPLYNQYEVISAEEAQALAMEQGRTVYRLWKRAEQLAAEAYGDHADGFGTPLIDRVRAEADTLADQNKKAAALLQFYPSVGSGGLEALEKEGYHPRLLRALALLAEAEDPERLREIRTDTVARAVKIADLNYELRAMAAAGQSGGPAERAGAVLRYLELESDVLPAPGKAGFCPALEVYRNMSRDALDGKKLPHGISNPVLRREDGILRLAFFVHVFSRKDMESGRLPRPSRWILADLETGAPVAKRNCAETDFCSGPIPGSLSVGGLEPRSSAQETLQRLYGQLDGIRKDYLATEVLDEAAYADYFEKMLLLVPPDWRQCYRQLSRP